MKILIAEDDDVSRRLLQAFLEKWDYDVVVTCGGREALRALQGEEAPRLAILDWMMPEMDGLEVCRAVRELGTAPYVYILLLTAKDQKQDVIAGIEAGADDYLTKPFDANELKARLRAGRRILALQETLISARDALRFQASHDPLTGLWNRAATMDALRRELARAEPKKSPLSLMMADFDHLKRVNDFYGRLAGDEVLQETARRMRSCVKAYDTVGRYGGEEFLLVFPECDAEAAMKQAERIRLAISGKALDVSAGPLLATVSLGVAAAQDAKAGDAVSLIRAADAALFRAKEQGRNRAELATTDDAAPTPSLKLGKQTLRRLGKDEAA